MASKILITPNAGSTTVDPTIAFRGAGVDTDITLRVPSTGGLSFEGTTGQLFSITDSMSGTIFSANDVSGIPSIEVLDTGLVKIAQYSGNVVLGSATDDGIAKLQVAGSIAHSNIAYNNSVSFTTASVAQVAVDSFSSTVYRSAKYFAQMTSGSAYHVTELNVVHNGTTAYVVEYGENKTGAVLGSFDASITTGVLSLLFTAANAVTTVKLYKTLFVV